VSYYIYFVKLLYRVLLRMCAVSLSFATFPKSQSGSSPHHLALLSVLQFPTCTGRGLSPPCRTSTERAGPSEGKARVACHVRRRRERSKNACQVRRKRERFCRALWLEHLGMNRCIATVEADKSMQARRTLARCTEPARGQCSNINGRARAMARARAAAAAECRVPTV
jgi:hypothetical protein